MSATQSTENKKRLKTMEHLLLEYFCLRDRQYGRMFYELGRKHEREHCKQIAARVRKELDK